MDIGLPFMLDLTPNALGAMLVVLAMLVVASITQWRLSSRLSPEAHLELKQRINSWWVMVAVVFTALMIGQVASLIFFAVCDAESPASGYRSTRPSKLCICSAGAGVRARACARARV